MMGKVEAATNKHMLDVGLPSNGKHKDDILKSVPSYNKLAVATPYCQLPSLSNQIIFLPSVIVLYV